MAKKTASSMVEDIADLAAKLEQAAGQETRTYLAREIENQFLGVSRPVTDDCIIEALADYPSLTDRRLQALRDRFVSEGVSEDFRAGLLFAVRLVADLDYEY
jgi:hypothetical protein